MNFILVKHINSDKIYYFKISWNKSRLVKKGDLLLVDTSRGHKLALAISDPIKLDDNLKTVIETQGATFPLKPVLSVATKEMEAYIVNRAINVCVSQLNIIRPNDELPY